MHWRTISAVTLVLLHFMLPQHGSECSNTLFSMAKDLSQEFGAHIAVVAFSPTAELKAYGAPTADFILRTYLPEIHSSPSPACFETVGEATTRVDRMKREAEETAFLAEAEMILVAQTSAGKQNWWEMDMEALGVDEPDVRQGVGGAKGQR
uniref:Uncharacterized protein n=1 Tax=Setaria italica TaxID=4555 RepID=K3ZDP9_SETIT